MCLFKGYSYSWLSAPASPVRAALVHFKLCSLLLLSNLCCCKEMGGNYFIERKIMKKSKGRVKIALSFNLDIIYYSAFSLL